MPRMDELMGQRFGRLTVIGYHDKNSCGQVRWVCKCDCGNEHVAVGAQLKRLHTKSCGCLQRESRVTSNTTHGMTDSPTYKVWENMRTRCSNPNRKQWKDYGGRGIKVCDRWQQSFEAFLSDMGERPSSKHTIERKDTNGNYEPGNCIWATMQEQNWNRREHHNLTIEGVTKCVGQWASEKGINVETLYNRIKAGTPESELFEPPGVLLTYQGKTLRANEWAKLLGIPKPTICQRLKRGLPVEKVLHVGKHKTGPK
jgi:hypothetical protein